MPKWDERFLYLTILCQNIEPFKMVRVLFYKRLTNDKSNFVLLLEQMTELNKAFFQCVQTSYQRRMWFHLCYYKIVKNICCTLKISKKI